MHYFVIILNRFLFPLPDLTASLVFLLFSTFYALFCAPRIYPFTFLPGVICAADFYQFTDLRDGGLQFFPSCIKVSVRMRLYEVP
jgi:hypothetical protein